MYTLSILTVINIDNVYIYDVSYDNDNILELLIYSILRFYLTHAGNSQWKRKNFGDVRIEARWHFRHNAHATLVISLIKQRR